MPGNGAVVGIVVQDSQSVMGCGRGDDEVHRRGTAMLSDPGHTVLHRADSGALRSSARPYRGRGR